MTATRKRRYSYRFTHRTDARIVRLRGAGQTHKQTARAIGIPLYLVTARISRLETLAKMPSAKVRICIRPDCETEFVSLGPGHRVCAVCRHLDDGSCEPFGNFVVVMA